MSGRARGLKWSLRLGAAAAFGLGAALLARRVPEPLPALLNEASEALALGRGAGALLLVAAGLAAGGSASALAGAVAASGAHALGGAGRAWPGALLFAGGAAGGVTGTLLAARSREIAAVSPLESTGPALLFAVLLGFLAAVLAAWPAPRPLPAVSSFAGAAVVMAGLGAGAVAAVRYEPILSEGLRHALRNQSLLHGALLLAGPALAGLALAGGTVYALGRSGAIARPGGRVLAAGILGTAALLSLEEVAPPLRELLACRLARAPWPLAPGLAGGAALLALVAGNGRRPVRVLAVGAIAAGLVLAHARGQREECPARPVPAVEWVLDDEPGVLARAAAERRPLAIYFYADWCAPCVQMAKTTFVNAAVAEGLERFARLKVDVTEETAQGERLKEKYGVRDIPTLLLIDPGGARPPERLTGFQGAAELAERLEGYR